MTPREVEEQFLTLVATEGDIKPALKSGISPSWFSDPACRRAWEMQLNHHGEHGRAATFQLYETHALGIAKRYSPDDDLATLAERVRISTFTLRTRRAVSKYQQAIDQGEVPVAEAFVAMTSALSSSKIADLLGRSGDGGTLLDLVPRFQDRVRRKQASLGITGIPTPWDSLDKATGGLNPGDYISLLGYRKAGKTDAALEVAVHVADECGEPALIISNELSVEDILARVACRKLRIRYELFHEGVLPPLEVERIMDMTADIARSATIAIEHINAFGLASISQVRAHIERYDPAFILWDGHQLSAESNQWEHVYLLSQRTRAMAREVSKPVMITAQLNPKKKEASFKAYHQDATVVVMVDRDGDWMHCHTPEVREGRPVRWSMRVDRGMPLIEEPWQGGGEADEEAVSVGVALPE